MCIITIKMIHFNELSQRRSDTLEKRSSSFFSESCMSSKRVSVQRRARRKIPSKTEFLDGIFQRNARDIYNLTTTMKLLT